MRLHWALRSAVSGPALWACRTPWPASLLSVGSSCSLVLELCSHSKAPPPWFGLGILEGQVTGSPLYCRCLVSGDGSVLPVALALSSLIDHFLEKLPVTLWLGLGWGLCHVARLDSERAKCPSQSKNVWILPSHCSLPQEAWMFRLGGCDVPACLLGCLTPLCWPWVFSQSPVRCI